MSVAPQRRSKVAKARRRRGSKRLLTLVVLALGSIAAVAFSLERLGYPPRLLALYIDRRAQGHDPRIERIGRTVRDRLVSLDRGERSAAQAAELPWVGSHVQKSGRAPVAQRTVNVATVDEMRGALAAAEPGQIILLQPGTYRVTGTSLEVARPGSAEAPITLRAAALGLVTLELAIVEGFHVRAPHWRFENLDIAGACSDDSSCEHAFHVVGGGSHFTLRNSRISDFNAHVKVNGADGRFPDHGRIIGSTLVNRRPRATDNPVTPIDMVAASDWIIAENLIADFVKAHGDQTSYGVFAKGAGERNRFERNVVLCEMRLAGASGRRVGLSFGGGGSGNTPLCRDGRCIVEHAQGVMRANLIAFCSDEGIYLNRAAQSMIEHNTLIDTAGINVRFPQSSAEVTGNLVDGGIFARDDAVLVARENYTTAMAWLFVGRHPVRDLFVSWQALDLRWQRTLPRRPAPAQGVDLCGAPRGAQAAYGAVEDFTRCGPRQ